MSMIIEQIYKRFPTQDECVRYLEKVYWHGIPRCPYCGSENSTALVETNRHHCNACNTSFSVTVGTIFHKTKIDLQKWFLAILLVSSFDTDIGPRQLAREVEVNKNTAMTLLARIRDAIREENQSVLTIAHFLKKEK